MSLHPETLYRIALKGIPGVGAITARNLVSYCGSAECIFRTSRSKLLRIPGVGRTIASRVHRAETLSRAERELDFVMRHQIDVHFYLDEYYPERLKHIAQAPVVIYSKGNADLNKRYSVAIVGTRRPTNYGRQAVSTLLTELAVYDPLVVSGLAHGIDVESHRSALQNGLSTVGVLANGLGTIYPRQHYSVAQRMLAKGGLVSEFDHDIGPERDQFPARNRIIAGLADVLIVVESGVTGGSMITATFAIDFNRDVAAVPGRVTDKMSAGCNHLISTHRAHLVTSGTQVADLMSWQTGDDGDSVQRTMFVNLSEAETLVVEVLHEQDIAEFELIRYSCKMTSSELASVLLSLEFKGVVKALPGKRFQRI